MDPIFVGKPRAKEAGLCDVGLSFGGDDPSQPLIIPKVVDGLIASRILSRGFEFSKCSKLVIPSTVSRLMRSAFSQLETKEIVFEQKSTLEAIDQYAFGDGKFETMEIPASVWYLGIAAFCNSNLKSISGGYGIFTINRRCFAGSLLKEIDFSKFAPFVTEIGDECFADSQIEQMVWPQNISIEGISPSAFNGCKKLSVINVTRTSVMGVSSVAKYVKDNIPNNNIECISLMDP